MKLVDLMFETGLLFFRRYFSMFNLLTCLASLSLSSCSLLIASSKFSLSYLNMTFSLSISWIFVRNLSSFSLTSASLAYNFRLRVLISSSCFFMLQFYFMSLFFLTLSRSSACIFMVLFRSTMRRSQLVVLAAREAFSVSYFSVRSLMMPSFSLVTSYSSCLVLLMVSLSSWVFWRKRVSKSVRVRV